MVILRDIILGEVDDERRRQIAKWGDQSHRHVAYGGVSLTYWREERDIAQQDCDSTSLEDISWEQILLEEVTEALAEPDWPKRRQELIQVMAVCLAEIEDGDTKTEALTPVSADGERQESMFRHPASQDYTGPAHPGDSECNSAGSST
jgi:hypothetical protein